MASPFFSSNFCALITGGRSAPSEGAPNTTMEIGSGAWAYEGDVATSVNTQAMLVKNVFMAIPPRKFLDLSGRTRDRIIEFLAQCREELADQVLGHAGQDALADPGDETADFADTLKLQATHVGTFGNDLEGRAAIAVTEGARARYSD